MPLSRGYPQCSWLLALTSLSLRASLMELELTEAEWLKITLALNLRIKRLWDSRGLIELSTTDAASRSYRSLTDHMDTLGDLAEKISDALVEKTP